MTNLHAMPGEKLAVHVLTHTGDSLPVYDFNSGEFGPACYHISPRVAEKMDWPRLTHALIEIHKDFGATSIQVTRPSTEAPR